MPHVRIDLYSGRSKEQKRLVAAAITDAFERILQSNPADVVVIFNEVEVGDWLVGGQVPDLNVSGPDQPPQDDVRDRIG